MVRPIPAAYALILMILLLGLLTALPATALEADGIYVWAGFEDIDGHGENDLHIIVFRKFTSSGGIDESEIYAKNATIFVDGTYAGNTDDMGELILLNYTGPGEVSVEYSELGKEFSDRYTADEMEDESRLSGRMVLASVIIVAFFILLLLGYYGIKNSLKGRKKKKDPEEFIECPDCNAEIKRKNMRSHRAKVHRKR